MTEPVFRRETLFEILAFVDERVAKSATIAFAVLDPDQGRGRHAGELVDGSVHRPWRTWIDLAERLGLRMLTPRAGEAGLVHLQFERLEPAELREAAGTEKYGATSEFARISKLEDPGFVLDLIDALARANLGSAPRILDLGVNAGDELALLARQLPAATIVGLDHSASALAIARTRFPTARLICANVNDLGSLGLGRFDLVISIATLQSPGIDDREVLRRVVQDHLTETGAVIFGFPNCRYVDGEVEYGTRMKNFRQPELGLLVKDIAFYRKYLQQHHRQVFVTGKYEVLVTGVYAPPGATA